MTVQSLRARLVGPLVSCGVYAAVCVVGVCAPALLPRVAVASAAEGATSEADEARAFHEKAKAAFALSHYAQAAEFFERAFELKSDPALLYNAAQSHRLAGNKQRALTLYQNYLRVYGRDERRAQIDQRIEELKRAIEKDRTEVPVPPPAGWPPGTPVGGAAAKSPGGTTPPARTAEPAKPSRPASPPVWAPAPPAVVAAAPAPAPVGPPPAPPSSPAPMPPPPAIDSAASSGAAPAAMLSIPSNSDKPDDRSVTQKPWFWIAIGGGVAAAAAVVLLLALSGKKDPTGSFGQIPGN